MTEEETAQIHQTIEMFEAITQSQKDDYQSLEILKEAYSKIGRTDDAMRTSRKLADAYFTNGQYSMAMLECEGILQREPDSPETVALLAQVEAVTAPSWARAEHPESFLEDASASSESVERTIDGEIGAGLAGDRDVLSPNELSNGAEAETSPRIHINFGSGNAPGPGNDAGLIETASTRRMESVGRSFNLSDDGSGGMHRFLRNAGVATPELLDEALEQTTMSNAALGENELGTSYLEVLCTLGGFAMDDVLSDLIDRTRFAFVPLENYEVEREVAQMLPEILTLNRLILPFDVISRTVLIALCNPFDVAGKEAAQQSVDYHVQWYLASPLAIAYHLRDAYRLNVE